MSKYKDYLEYYKRKLERNLKDENTVNQVFEKLAKSDFPVPDLVNTGIYKVVRGISKSGGEFADKALPLYNKWKFLLLAEQGDQTKPLPPQPIIPPSIKVFDTSDNYVNNNFPKLYQSQSDVKNGFNGMFQKNLFTHADNYNRSSCNPSPINEGGLKIKSSTIPVQPPVNLFQPFSTFSSTYQAPHPSVTRVLDCPPELNTNSLDYSVNSITFDTHSNHSNPFSSPRSSNSQNHLDISPSTASPSKVGRIPDPYTIEMKEGMFYVVKCNEPPTPAIVRMRRLYLRDDEFEDEEPPLKKECSKVETTLKTPKKTEPETKNSKSSEKTVHSKSKNHTPDKGNKHKSSSDKAIKSEKVKTEVDKSAIEKIKLEKNSKEGSKLSSKIDKNSSHKLPSKSSSKDSPSVKHNSKENPFSKSNVKGSPSGKLLIKGSPSKSISTDSPSKPTLKGSPAKSVSKGSPLAKTSSTKGSLFKPRKSSSPSVSVNHANSSPCDSKYFNPGPKDCDKKTNAGLTNEAAENFISSKKERTSIYSGKKVVQEIPKLHSFCVRILRKNIDFIRFTRGVPYKVLKPVLLQCSATQLRRIEENNMYLLEDTDDIWATMCKRKYRDVKPSSSGTWRDLYWRTREVQEQKLKNITASISASRQKAAPERKMMLTESPERPRSKKIKVVHPEPKEVTPKISPKEAAHNLFKESNTLHNSKVIQNKEISHSKHSFKESSSTSSKKTKKAPVAPLMSKVKKSVGFFAMQKK